MRSRLPTLLLGSGLLALCGQSVAEDKKPARIAVADPAEAKQDPDFLIQGEYEGTANFSGNETKVGGQVIARGNGQFVARLLVGGLPGAGWDGKSVKEWTAARVGSAVVVRHPEKDAATGKIEPHDIGTIADGVMTLKAGENTATLKRVERTSPTLGAKPPEGATALFAGPESLDQWQGAKTVKLSDGEFLAAASNPRTKAKFQGYTAHVEFRLAWMPNSTGQGRSNSGMYNQDRYEVQVLDSFGLKGVDNECGGIYKESAPAVNMCLPPGQWQTYDVDFTPAGFDADGKKTTPAEITVKHNGVVIHDKLKLKGPTPGGGLNKETPEPGAIYFQNHGDPVVYRNIWVAEKK